MAAMRVVVLLHSPVSADKVELIVDSYGGHHGDQCRDEAFKYANPAQDANARHDAVSRAVPCRSQVPPHLVTRPRILQTLLCQLVLNPLHARYFLDFGLW